MHLPKLSRRHAPFVYGIIQAAITTATATAIATYQGMGAGGFPLHWLTSWGMAWLTMLPVVIGVSPLIQRTVLSLTRDDDATDTPGNAASGGGP